MLVVSNLLVIRQYLMTPLVHTFGTKHILLGNSPTKLENNEIRDKVYAYSEKCMFDVFLDVCRDGYVGGSLVDSEERMIQEVCRKIEELKMKYKSGNNNRWTMDTLDEFYGKFISVIDVRPDDATK